MSREANLGLGQAELKSMISARAPDAGSARLELGA
jgi:hypothetical protein